MGQKEKSVKEQCRGWARWDPSTRDATGIYSLDPLHGIYGVRVTCGWYRDDRGAHLPAFDTSYILEGFTLSEAIRWRKQRIEEVKAERAPIEVMDPNGNVVARVPTKVEGDGPKSKLSEASRARLKRRFVPPDDLFE